MPKRTQLQQDYAIRLHKLSIEQRAQARTLYTQTPRPSIDKLALQFSVSYSVMWRALNTKD